MTAERTHADAELIREFVYASGVPPNRKAQVRRALDALVAELDAWKRRYDLELARAQKAEGEAFKAEAQFAAAREALTAADHELRDLGVAIAAWCPHGMDSSRSDDYGWASDFRGYVDRARAALAGSSGTPQGEASTKTVDAPDGDEKP